ncbi:hypothetical protein D3C87_1061030 [compost metagenome]
MRFLLVVATLILSISLASQAAPYYGKVFVDKEDGRYLTVFNDPGMDYDSCSKNKSCETLGWLDKDSEVEIVSPPVVVPKLDFRTKKVVDTEFVQVEFSYDRINKDGNPARKTKVIGWVESAGLTKDKVATFYGSDPEPIPCPPVAAVEPKKAAPVIEAKAIKRATENHAVVATANAISPYIGECVINPNRLPGSFKGPIPYDHYILPKMNAQPVPNLTKEDGRPVTRQDMVDIDAMARSVYSEMARCYKHGLHYPSAVARITLNRAAPPNGRESEFVCGAKLPNKGAITRALTCPSKYSAWNPVVNGERNPVLPQALCPPAPHNPVMWTGKAPSETEKDIWENTVRIATESVLYPKKFKSRSPNLTQLFYTSDLGRPKWKQVNPKVEGRTINKDYCLMIWQD